MAKKKKKSKAKPAGKKVAKKAKKVVKAAGKKAAKKVKKAAKPKKAAAPKAAKAAPKGKGKLTGKLLGAAAAGAIGGAALKPVPPRFDDLYQSDKTIDDLDDDPAFEADEEEEGKEATEVEEENEDGLNFDESYSPAKKGGKDTFFDDLDMYDDEDDADKLTESESVIEGDDDEPF
jgi:hypothetical protein